MQHNVNIQGLVKGGKGITTPESLLALCGTCKQPLNEKKERRKKDYANKVTPVCVN